MTALYPILEQPEQVALRYPFVYRVVRDDEDLAVGIFAKDDTAQKTARDHVRIGSGRLYRSQYVSITASSLVAYRARREYGGRIVEIATSDLLGDVIDLTLPEVRDAYGFDTVAARYAASRHELLLVGFILPPAYRLWTAPEVYMFL